MSKLTKAHDFSREGFAMITSSSSLLRVAPLFFLLPAVQLTFAADVDAKKAEAAKAQSFEGVVLPLAEVVKTQSPGADDDALKLSRILKTKDGTIYTLIKDDASRKFFMDDRLLHRPMKITAVQIPGAQMLAIVQTQSVIGGKLHDLDYWCETCQLSATEPGACKCCGNPVELRELPVEPEPATPSTPTPKR